MEVEGIGFHIGEDPIPRLSVDMWGFLGGLASGAANLLGGLFGQRNQDAINNQNLNAQVWMAQNAIQSRVADAKAAGINPLAALGSSFSPSAATAVGSDALPNAMSAAGQNLERAANAFQDSQSKSAQLDLKIKEAQLAGLENDVVAGQLRNSKLATAMAAPGSPPSMPYDWQQGGPRDPRPHRGFPDLYKTYWAGDHPLTLLDPDAQRSVFSGVPGAVTYPEISMGLLKQNLQNVPRPDVSRSIRNLGSSFDWNNPWLWQQ